MKRKKKKINLECQMFFINLKAFLYAYLAKDMWTKKKNVACHFSKQWIMPTIKPSAMVATPEGVPWGEIPDGEKKDTP